MANSIRTFEGGHKKNRELARAEKIINMINHVALKHDINTDELVRVIQGICAREERIFLYEHTQGMRAQARELLKILYKDQGHVDVAATVSRLLEIREQFIRHYN